jgi:hypothetical protein
MKVVVAGGSGALGRRIVADLVGRGDDVVVLSRVPRALGLGRVARWDGRTVGPWAAELSGAALINLCGELVDRRPTSANIGLMTRSRTEPTMALARAATTLTNPIPIWVQMSTLAIYGDAGEAVLDESATPAHGPPQMAGVATEWEKAALGVFAHRQVTLRTGIVLDRDTPALDRLTGIVRWGLGGRVGTGRHWISWLHVADLLAIVRRCLDDSRLSGIVHATSPHPVRNVELMAALRQALHRRVGLPTPTPIVRLGAWLLRTDPALALTGRRCLPARLQQAGFPFSHPDLREALGDLLRVT